MKLVPESAMVIITQNEIKVHAFFIYDKPSVFFKNLIKHNFNIKNYLYQVKLLDKLYFMVYTSKVVLLDTLC